MGRSWTKEQEQAIYQGGTNMIISAGAGSGKTAVLTERVIQKLNQGESIRHLLILTFTNAAASEMKERIRSALTKIPSLKEELDSLDSANITTFDGYALSLVKKYHYLLKLPKQINIVSNSIISVQRKKYLDEILEQFYQEKDPVFVSLIHAFCLKNDQNIRQAILQFDDKLNLRTDKIDYLEHYIEYAYHEEHLEELVKAYLMLIQEKIASLRHQLKHLEDLVDGVYFYEIKDALEPLLEHGDYSSWLGSKSIKLKNVPKGSSDDVKKIKKEISSLLKEIHELLCYESIEEIKEELIKNKDFVCVIIEILKQLDQKVMSWKYEHHAFQFHDIARMSLDIIKNHEEIRCALKNEFHEILVDEYQDTNDIQEAFISYIANHNVYMVGDIKQSIYQFRHANPYIFKSKYDQYRKQEDGIKIDLIKNFRSRKEVLEDINKLFIPIMGDQIGGANYKLEHQMIAGNMLYEEQGKTNENYHMDLLSYTYDKDSKYQRREIEIFAIAKDIQDKITKKYPIFDMNRGIMRPMEYRDCTILLQTGSDYDLYKKIFLYLNIPLQVYQDETIKTSYDVYIIKNIFILISSIAKRQLDASFKRAFMSVARSFFMEMDDQTLYDIMTKQTFKDSLLYERCKALSEELSFVSLDLLLEHIFQKFNVYDKLIHVGNIASALARLDYLSTVAKEASTLGLSLDEFITILEEVLNGDEDIKMKGILDQSNTVKLMNIHKSKGLEFPICYFASLDRKFNTDDIKGDFLYDKDLGFILPYEDHGLKDTMVKTLYKERYIKEMISERIRLFYVAVTRAKEKMIFVTDLSLKEDCERTMVPDEIKLKYRSLNDMLCSIKEQLRPYIVPLDMNHLELSKDYMLELKEDLSKKIKPTTEKIKDVTIQYQEKVKEDTSYSKHLSEVWEEDVTDLFHLGTMAHMILEILDFKHPDTSFIKQPLLKEKIEAFLQIPLLEHVKQGKIYQEYHFVLEETGAHGVIDLFIVYDDHIDLIDYKLKQIDDPAYITQLKGYQTYLEKNFQKPVHSYLYSLMSETLQSVK